MRGAQNMLQTTYFPHLYMNLLQKIIGNAIDGHIARYFRVCQETPLQG